MTALILIVFSIFLQLPQVFATCSNTLPCQSIFEVCESGSCKNVSCSTGADCSTIASNSICRNGTCSCVEGFSQLNSNCEKVLGRACTRDTDCGLPHLGCMKEKCVCGSHWYEVNGACVTLIGKQCSTFLDCFNSKEISTHSHHHGLTCSSRQCVCKPGYIEGNGVCQRVLYSRCAEDSDCPLDHSVCRTYQNCRCETGTSEINDVCVPQLGGQCIDVSCHSRSFYCNANDTCSCKHGFTKNGLHCLHVFGRSCSTAIDCGSLTGFICDENSRCNCMEGFQPEAINLNSDLLTCSSDIGKSCKRTSCPQENAACTTDNVCECNLGYFQVQGMCKEVLGTPCQLDEVCSVLNNTRCGHNGRCQCKEGYKSSNLQCFKVLHDHCSSISDCTVKDSVCEGNECVCSSGQEFDGKCLRNECATQVPLLNDIHRRSINYKIYDIGEPLIDDYFLTSGWFSIGIYSLPSANPGSGFCGTYYPIYLTDVLSEEQQSQMENGDIEVQAVVGDLSETIDIKLRKCGDDTHLYLKQTPPRLSAICIDINRANKKRQHQYYPFTTSSLHFKDETINNQAWYTPYIIFNCEVYGYAQFAPFFIVRWYADNRHISSYWTNNIANSNSTALHEDVLLSAGYKAGVSLMCSIQFLEVYGGGLSGEYFGVSQTTGLAEQDSYSTILRGNYYDENPNHFPQLGCASASYDTSLSCFLSFDLVDENDASVCSTSQGDKTKHPLCGYKLLGLTHRGSSHMNKYDVYRNKTYRSGHSNITSFQVRTIIVTSMESKDRSYFKVSFQPTQSSVGHTFWDGYTPPNKQYLIQPINIPSKYLSCYIGYSWTNNGILDVWVSSVNLFTYHTDNFNIYSVGEYTFAHLPSSVFTVQIRTEMCNNNASLCVCAATIRDGNSIFTYGQCGGIIQTGSLHGEARKISSYADETLSNSNLYILLSSSVSQGITISIYGNNNDEVEGLCSAKKGMYAFRSGIKGENVAGFIESWRVPYEESLRNPINHVDLAWTDEFYRCTCPSMASNISETELTYKDSTTSYYNKYIGVMQCNFDTKCSVDYQGIEGPGSLLPKYYIDSITVTASMELTMSSATVKLQCDFRMAEGVLYSVYWYIEDTLVKSCVDKTSTEAEECYLTNVEVFDDSLFFIDDKISCGTKVMSSSGSVLLGPISSDALILLEITTTTVDILRNGDATLILKNNILFEPDESLNWAWEFTVYDQDDKDCTCKDSSIAIKSNSGDICGTRVTKDIPWKTFNSNQQEVHITLTTKNNNKYSLKETFNLRLKTALKIDGANVFSTEFNKGVTVFVRAFDEMWQRKFCYSSNDPNMRTFDGRYWYLAYVGIFVMYRHTTLPVEVQLIVQSCNGGFATCSCGVIIRAGKDLFIYNHCHSFHMTKRIPGPNSSGGLFIRKLKYNRVQVYLPHGTRVDLAYSPRRWNIVNVNIYASPGDVNNVVGLCGQFNGNSEDDFMSRDGTIEDTQTNRSWWWWWWRYNPENFPKSWRLDGELESESLLNPDNIDNLPDWERTDILCVCPGNHNSEDSICSANEADTCTDDADLPGTTMATLARTAREDQSHLKDIHRRMSELRTILIDNSKRSISKRSTNNNQISDDETLALCNATLDNECSAYANRDKLVSSDANGTLLNCAADTAINPNVSWTEESCSRMLVLAEMEARRDVHNKNKNTTETIVRKSCIGNCSGNGECVDGTCICRTKFTTDTCFIDVTVPPTILRISGNGVCDPKLETCECIPLVTDGNADNAKCNITVSKATTEGKMEVLETIVIPAVVYDLNELACCYEFENKRRKRSTEHSVIGYEMIFSLSNDNSTFGNRDYVFVMDTTCQEVVNVSGQLFLSLKDGYCYIDGVCYTTGEADSGCGICDPSSDLFNWKDACKSQINKGSDVKFIIIGTVVGFVVVCIIVGAVVIKFKKKKMSVVQNAELYDCFKDTVANKKFKIREVSSDAWM